MKKNINQLQLFDLPKEVIKEKSFKNKKSDFNYVEFIKGLPEENPFEKLNLKK